MAVGIRIVLPVLWLVLAEGHFLDALRTRYRVPNPRLPHFPKRTDDKTHEKSPADKGSGERPIDGDVYSYNSHHSYGSYYHDGYPMNKFGYSGPFGLQNFDDMPGMNYGWPGINNEFNFQPPWTDHPTNGDDDTKKPEKSSGEVIEDGKGNDTTEKSKKDEINDKNKEPGPEKEDAKCDPIKNLEELPPKTNEIKNDNAENKTDLNANKDYLLVGNNGNNVYLLHENVPNQPSGNNVVYLQPGNQGYQVVNGQPQSNVPLAENKLNLNGYNVVQNVPNNSPSNSYVLIYANGQLIQVPGVVVNSQPNNLPIQNGNLGSNVVLTNPAPNNNINIPVPNPNTVYTTVPSQGNQPGSNVAGYPNNVVYANVPSQGIPNSNAPIIQNPNNVVYVPNQGIPNANSPVIQNPSNVVYSNIPNQAIPNANNPNNVVYANVPNQGVPNPNAPVLSNPSNVIYSNTPNQGLPNSNVLSNPNNVVYSNVPRGNQPNPMYVAVPTPNNGLPVQNPPIAVNPNPNNNLGSYGVAPQPQPSVPLPNNVNGYVPSNNVNPGPIVNNLNGGINNPGVSVQPAVAIPTNNNPIYQPLTVQQKDANEPVQNEPITNGNPQPDLQPADEPSTSIGIQPAIMVSGFKENDGEEKPIEDKDEDKENKKEKKEKKDKDKSKKKDKKKKK